MNLRSSTRLNLNFSSNDVQWGTGSMDHCIATAASNGSIIVWNVNYTESADRIISEHSRAVNRLSFNYRNPNWLVSAAQDGLMKLWDLRERKSQARLSLNGNSEAVRDICFNPANSFELAAAFENGTVQVWDLRRPDTYERKYNAHSGIALAVAYNDTGKLLASGGRDRTIKVWSRENSSKKVEARLQAIAPVNRIAWRNNSRQLASISLVGDSSIRLWDISRPFMNPYIFDEHDNVATGILWQGEDCIWSCSKDRRLLRSSLKSAKQPIKMLSHAGFGWSSHNALAFSLDKAPQQNRPTLQSRDSGLSTPQNLTRSSASLQSLQKGALAGPGASTINDAVYQNKQCTGIIEIENYERPVFKYLASGYLLKGDDPIKVCLHNSKVALHAGKLRTARTWETVALVLSWERKSDQEKEDSNEDSKRPSRGNSITKARTNLEPAPSVTTIDSATSESLHEGQGDQNQNSSTVAPMNIANPNSEAAHSNAFVEQKETISTMGSSGNFLEGSPTDSVADPGNPGLPLNGKEDTKFLVYDPDMSKVPWRSFAIIANICDYYIENGDVQFPATLITILGPKYVKFSRRRLKDVCLSYVELLQMHELFITATEIVKLSKLQGVRTMSEKDVEIKFGCHRCFKPLSSEDPGQRATGFWYCARCRRLLDGCVICGMPMRKRSVWCQGCSHASHIECLERWFSGEGYGDVCPAADCGHHCAKSLK